MALSDLKTLAVTNYKKDLDSEIKRARLNGDSNELIIQRLFYFRRSPISLIHDDPIFKIFNAVAKQFNVPFKSIYVSGSAQTGHSLFKMKDFAEDESDLDLAIVDASLFQHYSEVCYRVSNGYADLTKFKTDSRINDVPKFFKDNLAKGWFRPDVMPNCPEKTKWDDFFRRLSNSHIDCFKSINCGVYLSPLFFEKKLVQILNNYTPQ